MADKSLNQEHSSSNLKADETISQKVLLDIITQKTSGVLEVMILVMDRGELTENAQYGIQSILHEMKSDVELIGKGIMLLVTESDVLTKSAQHGTQSRLHEMKLDVERLDATMEILVMDHGELTENDQHGILSILRGMKSSVELIGARMKELRIAA